MTERAAAGAVGRSLAGVLASAAAGMAVLIAGRDLPVPHRLAGHSVERWWQAVGPLVAVFALARLCLIAVAALVVLAFAWLTLALGVRSGSALARSVLVGRGLPGVGALLRLAIALSATGAAVAGCGTGGRAVAGGGAAGQPPSAPTLTNTAAPRGPSVAVPTPSRPRPRPADALPAAGATAAASAAPAAPSSPAPPGGRWLVRPGDSLWSIAEATVRGTPDQVAGYWAELVAANRPTLPDPADPSLLFPGDVVVLPHLRAAPR